MTEGDFFISLLLAFERAEAEGWDIDVIESYMIDAFAEFKSGVTLATMSLKELKSKELKSKGGK